MFVVVVMLFGDRYANPIVTRTGTLVLPVTNYVSLLTFSSNAEGRFESIATNIQGTQT
jgi:hypothetical protein